VQIGMGTEQVARGREAAHAMIRFVHEHAFDAHLVLRQLLVDGDREAAAY